jgi:acetyl-CoA carboxylase alpha subunit
MLNALIPDYSDRPNRSEKRKTGELLPFLETYIARKQQQMDEILQVVERYEKKRAVEEKAYQTMSPFRRMLSGRKPDHHLAVEYIHYVKKPMEQVKRLRNEIEAAKSLMAESRTHGEVELPESMLKEMI